PSDYAPLIETLRPVRKHLLTPLALIFRDTGRSDSERYFATTLLAEYAADDPDLLAKLLLVAGPKSYKILFPVADRPAAKVGPLFQAELEGFAGGKGEDSEQFKEPLAERQARAAIALIRLKHDQKVWPLLQHRADPRLRSFIVNWLNPLGADPKAVAAALAHPDAFPRPVERGEGGRGPGEGPAAPATAMDRILFHPETSRRRALILALGTYGTKHL